MVVKEKSGLFCSTLTALAFVLWIVSSFQTQSFDLTALSDLGLFSILPVTFFVAFGLLIFSFFITLKTVKKSQTFLLFFQSVLLILFINLTPAIIEGTPRFSAGYSNFASVDYIEDFFSINPSAIWIHNWPTFSIFIAIFNQITTIPWDSLMLVYPTIFNILLLPALYVVLNASGQKSTVTWLGIWLIFLGNWVGQDYFSIQSMGFFFIVLLLFLLFKSSDKTLNGREWLVLFFLLFAYLVTSHLLSSLVIVSVCLIFLLLKQTYRKPFFFLLLFTVIGWTVIDANAYLSNNLSRISGQFLNFSEIFQGNFSNRLLSGSYSHMLAAEVRVIYSLAIIIFGAVGIVIAWRSKTLTPYGKQMLSVLLGVSLLIFAFAYGGELYMRIYMFSLIPLSYFAAQTILNHKKLFCISILFFSIFAPSLFMIAHYGNETTYYVPKSEITGTNFLYGTTINGQIYGGNQFQGGDFRNAFYHSNYTYYSFRELYFHNSSSYLWTVSRDNYVNRYVCVSYATLSYFDFFYGYPQFTNDIQSNITQSVSYNKLYDNPSFDLYNSAPVITNSPIN